ncbi:MAG: hypothetical protein QW304_01140 [Thermoproteota archaeon]
MAKISRDRRGISESIVSVILFAIVITTSISALFYAQLNLSTQSGQTDFENAKASMINLAQTIEGLSLSGKGTAAYVRIASKTGGVWLTRGEEKIKITVGGETREYDVNLVRFRSDVSSVDFQVFKGLSDSDPTRCLIVSPDSSAPLGWVYLKRSQGAWIIVDFGRVRIVPTGRVRVNENNYFLVDVTYVEIVRGAFGGSDTYNICAKVKDVKVETIYADPSSTSIIVERGGFSETYPIDTGGEVQAILVFLNIVEVEVSTGG